MDVPIDWTSVDDSNVPVFSLEDKTRIEAKVVRVVDGDSVDVVFPVAGKIWKWKGRIAGIDTPETRTRDLEEKALGLKAKERVVELVDQRVVFVRCLEFDKYGRLLLNVEVDGKDVATTLIEEGLAAAYDGTGAGWVKN